MSSTDKGNHSAPRHIAPGKTGYHSAKRKHSQGPEQTAAPGRPAAEEFPEHAAQQSPRRHAGGEESRHRSDPHKGDRQDPENNRKKKRRREKTKKVLLIVAVALAVIIAAVLLWYFLWVSEPEVSDVGLKQPSSVSKGAETTSAANGEKFSVPEVNALPAVSSEPTATPASVKRKADTYTMLVVGRDRVGSNTDTIMVARMDCGAGTLDVVSIPRDTLVNVPWGVKKINSVYGAMGTEGLVEYVENLVGFGIDSYVIINTFVFQDLIDSIGGVYFDVPINMYYDDPGQGLSIHLSAGYQLLNGAQAEGVVRFRKNNDGTGYPQGDLARIETQHAFLKTLAKQMLSLGNITNLPEMMDIVLNNTDTNLTSGNIAFYAQEFLKLNSNNINFYTAPYDSVYIRGGSYISIKLDEWVEMVNQYLNPFTVDVSAANLDVLTYDGTSLYSTTGNIPTFDSFYDYFG